MPTEAEYLAASAEIAAQTAALWATLHRPEQKTAALALCASLKAARTTLDGFYGVVRPDDGGDPKPGQ